MIARALRGDRRTVALVVLALAVVIALLHAETLFGGRVYFADDVGDEYWPSRIAILRALTLGELPTWEPRAWGGYPLIAVPNYGAFYPPNALFWLLGAARGVAWIVAIHQLLGGAGMLVLLRRRGLMLPAASFGAFAYALGTFSIERIRHLAFAQMIAWIPLALVGLDDILDRRTARGVSLVALALGLIGLAGALPLLPFVLALALAYVLPRAVASRSWLVWGALAGSLMLGAGVAAAQIVPTLWHLPLSPRRLGVSYEFASTYAWPSMRWLVTLVAPDMFGVPHYGRWFGPPNHWELAGYYASALAVALAFAAPVARKHELAALVALSLLAIGVALGDAGPVHPFLFRHLPLYASLRCPARALVTLAVTVPILAAEGIERLGSMARSERAFRGWVAALLVFALALVAVRAPSTSGGLAGAEQAAAGHLLLQVVALCGCGALATAGVAYTRVAWMATAFVVVDLFSIGHAYLEPWPADSPTALTRDPTVKRLLAVVGDDRAAFAPGLGLEAHNLGLAADFRAVGGYDPFPVWRWVELLWIASNGRPYPRGKLREDVGVGQLEDFDSPLVDLMNVRWLVSTDAPGAGWIERTPAGTPTSPGRLRLFENQDVMPPAFLAHRVRVEPSVQAQTEAITEIDPRREVVLDRVPSPAPATEDAPILAARIVRRARTRLEIETDDPRDAVLVVSETMYPGWMARIDGARPTDLSYADYALRGLAVPAGKHRIEMWFEPPWGRSGEALTLASLAFAGALPVLRRLRRSPRSVARRA